jgi:hypothetical protein
MDAASRGAHGAELDLDVQVGELGERIAWLNVVAFAPFGADVPSIASEIREHALAALHDAGFLPA